MLSRPLYPDRERAGTAVAGALSEFVHRRDVLVVGVPRGGAVVARAVADALGAPLEILVVRKVGVPGMEEVALGAIAEGSEAMTLDDVAAFLGVSNEVIARLEARERRQLQRRVQRYRDRRPLADVQGRTVILVDDGLSSGATIRAATALLRTRAATQIVVACPVGSLAGCNDISPAVDRLVVLDTPEPFGMVSDYYEDFAPVSDDAVLRALDPQLAPSGAGERAPDETHERLVHIPADGHVTLAGDLGVPNEYEEAGALPHGLVIFAHGGGSSRQSYRNRFLAGILRMAGWATLRVDLLSDEEQQRDLTSGVHRFDTPLIGQRLTSAVDWAVRERVPGMGKIVLFGASTGAAAAVLAAVARPHIVAGVIARGGRVDLAGDSLKALRVPILLIVGGSDPDTLRADRSAIRRLRGDVTLKIVAHAGHTFEEPGAIGAVGDRAISWLRKRLVAHPVNRSLAMRLRDTITSVFAERVIAAR